MLVMVFFMCGPSPPSFPLLFLHSFRPVPHRPFPLTFSILLLVIGGKKCKASGKKMDGGGDLGKRMGRRPKDWLELEEEEGEYGGIATAVVLP
jgi:hypothetical protein